MFSNKPLSMKNLEDFDFYETKNNIKGYFKELENLEWELIKLNGQKTLTRNYGLKDFDKKQYISKGQDEFNLVAKERIKEQLKKYLSDFQIAKNLLSDIEQLYIVEVYVNRKRECEFIDTLGFSYRDNHEYRRVKKSAIYKLADVLGLVVEKNNEEKVLKKKLGGNNNYGKIRVN